jgi:hypothetical protein
VGPNVAGVPGLHLFTQFVSDGELAAVEGDMFRLHNRITALVPQSAEVRSGKHNLSYLEMNQSFVPIVVREPERLELELPAEHFAAYGDAGHRLTYFRSQLPLVAEKLAARFPSREVFEGRDTGDAPRLHMWKFTFNSYGLHEGTQSGFPYHVDIAATGAVTSVLSLLRGGQLEFIPLGPDGDVPGTVEASKTTGSKIIDVTRGSLIVLSGEARYRWAHRVVPCLAAEERTLRDGISRFSAVPGCRLA